MSSSQKCHVIYQLGNTRRFNRILKKIDIREKLYISDHICKQVKNLFLKNIFTYFFSHLGLMHLTVTRNIMSFFNILYVKAGGPQVKEHLATEVNLVFYHEDAECQAKAQVKCTSLRTLLCWCLEPRLTEVFEGYISPGVPRIYLAPYELSNGTHILQTLF